MNSKINKVENGLTDRVKTVRPLARLLARELNKDEIEHIAAGQGPDNPYGSTGGCNESPE